MLLGSTLLIINIKERKKEVEGNVLSKELVNIVNILRKKFNENIFEFLSLT
jgi:hypothetical protein